MQTFDFIPADTLFCRDGRPLAAGSSFGRGAHLPLPPLLHAAIRATLLRSTDCTPRGKNELGSPRPSSTSMHHKHIGTASFQWLSLRGPFPVKEESTFFPIPRDLVAGGAESLAYLRLRLNQENHNDLPVPLRYAAASDTKPSKDDLPAWVDFNFLQAYLNGNANNSLQRPPNADLWTSEYRIGVALDDESHIAADGQLYAAEHLRLRDGVRLRFAVPPPPDHHARREEERNMTLDDMDGTTLQLGGERRFGRIEKAPAELKLPSAAVIGTRVKWLLLAPAIFAHGWRPGWIAEDGTVKLRVVDKEDRRAFRRQRRDEGWHYNGSTDTADPIGAKLVAAVIGKPQPISGWDPLHNSGSAGNPNDPATGGGKPTFLAVPAGSVFYFEANDAKEAGKLAIALQGRCRSDFLGEKGLGLGVCGNWQHQTSADVS